MESILSSIKKLLGIAEEYTHFDPDIIMHINSVLAILNQMGVGNDGFQITGPNEIWTDFTSDVTKISYVKSFVELKVKLLFDPPLNSAVIQSMNELLKELEWRLYSEKNF